MKPLTNPILSPEAAILKYWIPRWYPYHRYHFKLSGTLVLPYRTGARIIKLGPHTSLKMDGNLLLGFRGCVLVPPRRWNDRYPITEGVKR